MSKADTIKAIKKELKKININIDLKVIKGLEYTKEAQEHKRLFLTLIELGA